MQKAAVKQQFRAITVLNPNKLRKANQGVLKVKTPKIHSFL